MKEGIILKAQHGCWDLPKRLKKFLKSIKKDFVVRTYGETNFLDSRNVYLEPRNKEAIEKNLPKIKKILKELDINNYGPDEWIKLSVKYYHGNMTIEAIRLSDYSLLGKITIKEKPWSRRPLDSDVFCGFFTTQYGKNKILVDNFGISRYLPDKPFYDQ